MNRTRTASVLLCLAALCANRAPAVHAQDQGVTLYYENNAQVELFGPDRTRILIDVALPEKLVEPPQKSDILLTTHDHSDHLKLEFSFPGKKLQERLGEINLPGVRIKSVAASHSPEPPTDLRIGSNYIFIIEMAGLRIVHFGDTEQEDLTAHQIAEIGAVDIAIMEFWITPTDRFFRIADAVKPRLVIPTHLGDGAAARALQKWQGYWTGERSIALAAESLPAEASILFMGTNKAYGKFLNLPVWTGE